MVKENIRKVALAIIFVLIIIVIALFIGRFTYSYLAPQVDEELKGEGEVTPTGDTIIFSKGNDLSISASTDNFYTGSGNLTDTTNPQVRLISSSDTNNASSTYYAGFRINKNTFTYSTSNKTAELILTIRDENGNIVQSSSDTLSYVTVNGVSGFDITGKTGAFNVVINHPISTTSSTTGTTHTWTYTLTFVNLSTDQSINENATLDMDVILQKDRIEQTLADLCNGLTLAECITTKVYDSSKVDETGLYYHDTNLANSAEDNSYRYAGANPNNYVCFGSDVDTCPYDNLYRIIGVFGSEVKLIKADYLSTEYGAMIDYESYIADYTVRYRGKMDLSDIGVYAWDSGNSNTWSSASLNNTLNTTYLNSLGTTGSNKISTHTWYVGGFSTPSATSKTFYNAESSGTTWSGKIGLMYLSDYGYAASNSYWTTSLWDYAIVRDENWIYLGSDEWTISPDSSRSDSVFFLFNIGCLNFSTEANAGCTARPVFYLNSNVSYVSGDGTQSNPFRIN